MYQLGDSLITDSVQALVELVKNSYDADATYCKVTILTGGPAPAGSLDRQSNGWLVIEDNGTGMDYEDIKRGWLTIWIHQNEPSEKRNDGQGPYPTWRQRPREIERSAFGQSSGNADEKKRSDRSALGRRLD